MVDKYIWDRSGESPRRVKNPAWKPPSSVDKADDAKAARNKANTKKTSTGGPARHPKPKVTPPRPAQKRTGGPSAKPAPKRTSYGSAANEKDAGVRQRKDAAKAKSVAKALRSADSTKSDARAARTKGTPKKASTGGRARVAIPTPTKSKSTGVGRRNTRSARQGAGSLKSDSLASNQSPSARGRRNTRRRTSRARGKA